MKKKYTGIMICLILAVLVAVGILTAVLQKNTGRETVTPGNEELTPTVTVTPTLEPTPAVEPTAAELPTPTVTAAPTGTPGLTPATEPTKDPGLITTPTTKPTAEPTAEPTAAVTPTTTLMPTSTPIPTATPMPTPSPTLIATPKPTPTPLVQCTQNGEIVPLVQTFQVSDTTYIYVFENGRTGIADTSTGVTLKLATEFENPETVDVVTVVAKIQNTLDKNNVAVEPQYRPTPTPTPIPPTPFPTPNPEQPKMLASYKGDKDYGSVTVEAWDNGYLYIKGTGTFYKYTSMDYHPQDLMDYLDIVKASGYNVSHICIEEGITQLSKRPAWSGAGEVLQNNVRYIDFPSSFVSIKKSAMTDTFKNDVTITGYKNGENVTFVLKAGDNLYDALKKNFDIEIK